MGVWATWLADAARTTGYPVIEVAGWRTRGHGPMRLIEGVVGHHTGTPERATGDYPSLRVVRDGRSDLPGPLCNLGLGRSGTIYVVAAGTAWHAGASVHSGPAFRFVDLNDEYLGIEAESAGGGVWTPQQLDAYPKLVGALVRYLRRSADRYVSHRDCALPRGRKPDPRGLTDDWMITRARSFVVDGPAATAPATLEDDDMAPRIEVDPDGSFHEAFGAEAGKGSVYTRGFVTFGSTWGWTDIKVTALGAGGEVWALTQDKYVRIGNNRSDVRELPAGTRSVTVEGKVEHPTGPRRTRPWASYIGSR